VDEHHPLFGGRRGCAVLVAHPGTALSERLNFAQVTDVQLGDRRKIQLTLVGGEIVELPALPKAKKLVAEIQGLVAKL